ncbi:hypothetical protein, partial [Listeria monocytogenes]|uniref:hypothetical protein n=1 Tax=Listeria monocytogenes TaxID=1639 RepID=UPI002FDB9BDF
LLCSNSSAARYAKFIVDVPSTNQVVAANEDKILRITTTDCTEDAGVTMPESTELPYMVDMIPTIDAYLIGKVSNSVPILARSNFA